MKQTLNNVWSSINNQQQAINNVTPNNTNQQLMDNMFEIKQSTIDEQQSTITNN